MTEIERWLKKYGKATTTTNKKDTHTNATGNSTKAPKKDVNERVREIMKDFSLSMETPEQKMQRRMNNVAPNYRPGVHTQNFSAPSGRIHFYINCELEQILHYGGEVIDIKTTGNSMFTNVLLMYKMPDWDVILKIMYGDC